MSPNTTSNGKSNETISIALGGGKEQKCHAGARDSLADWKPSDTSAVVDLDAEPPPAIGDLCKSNGAVSTLVGELLSDIYGKVEMKRRVSGSTCDLGYQDSDHSRSSNEVGTRFQWTSRDLNSLRLEKEKLEKLITEEGSRLVKYLKKKNFLLMKREVHYDIITACIQAISPKTSC
ncbi:hypothetical protein RUM44_000015 [Polyplax serrata]|uniref:Uncharacterized protein n=1 Tax=Polyplax serrata TaxID=468196 RepID=A0ABR1B4A4_POLSC